MPEENAYPSHWEADVVLRDGATAHLRPVLPTDQDALAAMYSRQSERTIYLRFFTYKSSLSAKELARFTTVDHQDRVAFVIMLGAEMIGIGRFDRTNDPHEAEVAFFISDAHHGRGIGSILLEHLAAAGLERGITKFSAEVLPENRKMLNVFSEAGFEVARVFDDGVVMVNFDIDPTEKSREVMASREHRAEAKSVSSLIAPRSIAVIGASRDWSQVGHEILVNVVEGGFAGPVYGINPEAFELAGMKAYPSIDQVPEPVDLAIITVPISEVAGVVEECGRAGVRGVCIVTGGYADDGARGRTRQQSLVRTARSYGMRVIGPASLGLINTDPAVSLNASLSPSPPTPGGLGLFSQSAAIGVLLYTSARRRDLGFSTILSGGNRADVSGNDMMQYWEDDGRTTACCMYLESIGNPRKFSRIARRLARTKPVIVAKSDVTGVQLPPGHTGRTSSAPPEALNAMFRQSGVIRAETSEHLMDIAQLVVSQPLPRGRRVAVFSNAFALGRVISDACASYGVEATHTEHVLDTASPDIDILDMIRDSVLTALRSSDVDAAVASFLPSPFVGQDEITEVLADCGVETGKPVLAAYTGVVEPTDYQRGICPCPRTWTGADGEESLTYPGVPCYESPGAAIGALAAVMDYMAWRAQEDVFVAEIEGTNAKEVDRQIQRLSPRIPGEGLLELSSSDAADMLSEYGISVLESVPFETKEQAVEAADRLGYPVALKAIDPTMRHRIDLGGVRLGIEDQETLLRDIDLMHRTLATYGDFDLEVQSMAPTGQNCVIRAMEDPLLGPVLSFGIAGDTVNLLDDWAHRVPPLTQRDVEKLVRSPKAARKLFGYDGLPPVAVELLEDLIRRVAELKDRHPEIALLELNPVMISENALTVLDCTVELGNPEQRTDSARRTMSRS
ncbi:GNAT family N-acetyltransferase [Kocuria koreensis]|jgi:acyl-CoA synthetase (NDP forming)/RimJ/RimL family protein N-acetyltransferase|uniref:GNAT family N-acetyltransferase n=1 Tax=Rothia koreensis TaxID=592378 RepID=A0A7K1LHL7_9MICC|nr:bifunctional GNAT family N-acetyltransferase/acetate--CoA ligase family protein [Rothia koreensis]MUN54685.1 GNAT family N-acetyltransferase [Rothia koreensis]